MLCLFSLILILFSFFSAPVLAEPGEFKTIVSSSQSQNIQNNLNSNTTLQASRSDSTDLYFKTPTIAGSTTLSAKIKNSNVKLQQFSIEKLNQSQIDVGFSWQKNSFDISVNHSQDLLISPVSAKSYSFSIIKNFYSNTSAVGVKLSETSFIQPSQDFISPINGASVTRPIHLRALEQNIFYEQILNDRIKGNYNLIFGQRSEDRPDHYGIEIKHAIAIQSHYSLRVDTGWIEENRHQSLKDEKGYFSTKWVESSVYFQPNFDWQFALGIGTVIEQEFQPSPKISDILTQVGTDQLATKVNYLGSGWSLLFTGKFGVSNTGQKTESLSGEFSWEI